MSQPAALAPEHQVHARKINQARHDPWGDPHGGGLTHAVMDAHRAGMPHSAIAHYSGLPIERVALMASVAKSDGDPFGVAKKLSDPDGNYLQRSTRRNTRGQNSAAGATVGGALYGTLGAAVGGAVGRSRAKAGVRALHGIGAAPSRARTAGIVAGHSLRTAGKAGAVLGAAGAAYGGALGAVVSHRKDHKKLPFGRVQKNDGDPFGVAKSAARMGEQAAEWTGHLPKHTPGAVAAGKSSFRAGIEVPGFIRPVKPGLRVQKPRFTRGVAKSAFGVEHEVGKGLTGHRGDKRNTQYVAGTIAGSQIGRRGGMRLAGTSTRGLANSARMHGALSATLDHSNGQMLRGLTSVKGMKAGLVGDVAGTVAGAAGVHALRRRRKVTKSAFDVEHEIEKKKIPNVLPGERRRATGKVVKVRSVGVKPDPQRGERGQRRVVRSGRL